MLTTLFRSGAFVSFCFTKNANACYDANIRGENETLSQKKNKRKRRAPGEALSDAVFRAMA